MLLPSGLAVADFTPRDEVGDWAIATGHELVSSRLEGRSLWPLINAARNPQAVWELLVTVSRSVAAILRPLGQVGRPGPIAGDQGVVFERLARSAPARPAPERATLCLTAAQLIGCAVLDDFAMVRALAAAVVSLDDERMGRAHLVLRAMLEILATEPVDPQPQEPTS